VKLGYDINNHWNVFADANITHFNAGNPGTESSPLEGARQWITRGAVALGVENHFDKTSGRISVYDNFGRHKINDGWKVGANPTTRYFRSKDALMGISWYQSASFFSGNRTTVGVDYQHIYGKAYYTSIETGEVLDTPNKQSGKSYRNEVAGYVDFRQDLTSWLTIDAGIRLDHHSITGSEWIPQGGFVIRPMATGELKAMVSKGFRNPTMREMYLYPPSNTDLEPERMMNYELAWKHHLMGGALTYGINLYYIKGDNMIQTAQVDGKPRNVNTGAIENRGAEVELGYRINNHWSVNTNHSVLHMENHVLGAPEYKGYLGGTYRQGKWTVNAGLQQIAGLITNTTTDHKENFTLLNATVDYQVSKTLSLWVKGDNLLAQKYEINEGFPMPRASFMGGVNIRL
jgi:iron complex outermembrane receptor protein